MGMMLAADIGQEALLLELAYELEEARPLGANPSRSRNSRSQSDPSFVQHALELALLRRGQLGQDAGISVADRGLRAFQQRAALTGQAWPAARARRTPTSAVPPRQSLPACAAPCSSPAV